MALGLALTYWISRTRDVRRRERISLYAASLAVAIIGGVLCQGHGGAALPADIRSLPESLPHRTRCPSHGAADLRTELRVLPRASAGRGDGPLAASLRPRPADFRVHMAAGHTDGELFT